MDLCMKVAMYMGTVRPATVAAVVSEAFSIIL
jgi:hypothetical protein